MFTRAMEQNTAAEVASEGPVETPPAPPSTITERIQAFRKRHARAELALFFLALPAFTFALTPLFSHWSRKHEFEADAYAARQTRAADLVSALVKLYRDNAATLTPDPLYSRFYDSHPPAALRIAHLQALD